MIPVRLDDCTVPEGLGRWQRVDIQSPDAYERLEGALAARARDLELTPP